MFEKDKPYASRSIMGRYVMLYSLPSILLWDGFYDLIHGL